MINLPNDELNLGSCEILEISIRENVRLLSNEIKLKFFSGLKERKETEERFFN